MAECFGGLHKNVNNKQNNMIGTTNDVIVLTHLGLGDHIAVNGAIRRIYEDNVFDTMYMVVKEHFLTKVQFMYRDLTKIKYLTVGNNAGVGEAHHYIDNFPGKVFNCWWYNTPNNEYIEENLFTSLGYTWNERYDSFKIPRDNDREVVVYNQIVGEDDSYIFVADDPTRGYTIDPFRVSELAPTTRIIRSSDQLDFTPFDLLLVIEKAKEIHAMHSTFFLLADCMSLGKIYLHNSYLLKIDPIEQYGEPMSNWLHKRNITAI